MTKCLRGNENIEGGQHFSDLRGHPKNKGRMGKSERKPSKGSVTEGCLFATYLATFLGWQQLHRLNWYYIMQFPLQIVSQHWKKRCNF